MAIQMRRGNLVNYDEDKMLPGEFAVATDEEELYIAFGTGNSKRVLTEDDLFPQTVQGVWTGKCTTTRDTQVKTVTLDNPEGFSLRSDVLVAVTFSSGNNVANPKLNINNTGEVDVKYNTGGVLYPLSSLPYYQWGPGVVIFRYYNNRWYKASADMGHIKYLNDYKANLDSPAFTGTPTAPTASSGTSSTQVATTAFVQNAISASAKSLTATDQGSGVVALSLT